MIAQLRMRLQLLALGPKYDRLCCCHQVAVNDIKKIQMHRTAWEKCALLSKPCIIIEYDTDIDFNALSRFINDENYWKKFMLVTIRTF